MDLLRPRRVASALCALGLLPAGCNFFRPQEPEPPSSSSLFAPDYTDPLRTLSTLRRAVELANQQGAYVDGLADSTQAGDAPFNATHDPADVVEQSQIKLVPGSWPKARESGFYGYLTTLGGDTTHAFQFSFIPGESQGVADSIGTQQSRLRRLYVYFILLGDTLARGHVELRFSRSASQQWKLVHWVDRRDPAARPGLRTLGWHRLESS